MIEKLNKHTSKEQREKVYEFAPMRGLFVDLLDDAQMAALVQALGGTLDQQLSWMAAEGTNGGLVFAKVRQAPDDQLAKVSDRHPQGDQEGDQRRRLQAVRGDARRATR